MPASNAAASDDAFSAAFNPSPSTGSYAPPANDAFSAAFAPPPSPPSATPSAADLIARAKAQGGYQPTPEEAQQMADDLAQIAARHQGSGGSADDHPRWDIVGDTLRAATASYNALKEDVTNAFSPERDAAARGQGLAAEAAHEGGKLLSITKIPLDAMGILSSPLTGATHAIGGSLLSYLPGYTKEQADQDVDTAMLGLGPRRGSVAPPAMPASEIAVPGNRLVAPSETPMPSPALPSTPEAAPVPQGASTAAPEASNRLMGAPEATATGAAPSAASEAPIPEKLPPRPILPIMTKAAAGRQADRIIAHFANGGPATVDTSPLVAGSTPTLAQATANPGIATLERGFRDLNPNPFVERAAANGDARAQAFIDVAGTPADIQNAEIARDVTTAHLRDAAFADPQPVDPLPVVSKIKEIMAGPEGKRDAVKSALTSVYNKIIEVDPSSGTVKMETDPQQLYGVRKSINDSLSPLAQGTASDGRQASRELLQIRDALDDVIESGAPGFKNYIQAFSERSAPIDGMRYLQSLNLTNANGQIMLGKLDSAIKAIEKQQGMAGVRAAKTVDAEQLAGLKAIRDDMRREGNSSLGKSLGSNTFQNLATNQLTANLGHPLVHVATGGTAAVHPALGVPLMGARYGAEKLAARGERMVQQALQERLLDAEKGKNALISKAKPSRK